jgi:hypothetical protein
MDSLLSQTRRHFFRDCGIGIGLVVSSLFLGLLAGCSRDPLAQLNTPQQLTLYSIDGRDFEPGEEPKTDEKFHGYPVLGKVEITDESKRRELITALRDGFDHSDGKMAKCFWPRHALRLEENGRTIDIVICFECYQVEVRPNPTRKAKAITRDPQPLFDQTLTDADVKLAPKNGV